MRIASFLPPNVKRPPIASGPRPAPWTLPGFADVLEPLTSRPDPASYFMNQMTTPNNPDAPAWTMNCGPTALAMAARAFGMPFKGKTVQQQIDSSLLASTGAIDYYAGSWPNQLIRGAQAAGMAARGIASTLEAVDAALAKGEMVVAWGYPRYARKLGLQPHAYSYADGAPYEDGHYVLITGKTADGKYQVNDSLSKLGPLTLSRALMGDYMSFPQHGDLVWSVAVKG